MKRLIHSLGMIGLLMMTTFIISAQQSPDGDGTLFDLIRQIDDRSRSPNADITLIALKEPINGDDIYITLNHHEDAPTYQITNYDEQEVCFLENGQIEAFTICRPLTDLISVINSDALSIDELSQLPHIRDDRTAISGLFVGEGQIKRNAGYFVQLLEPLYQDQYGLIIGVDYTGPDSITHLYISSLWAEYFCMGSLVGMGEGYGVESMICMPYHHIAYMRPINDSDAFQQTHPYFHIDNFMTSAVEDGIKPLSFGEITTTWDKWLEADNQQVLEVSLMFPIQTHTEGDVLSQIQIAKETDIEEDEQFMFSRLGEDYFCVYQTVFLSRLQSHEICITFYNVSGVGVVNE